jgi:predicted Rossmann-fold nucleotide-binding protein
MLKRRTIVGVMGSGKQGYEELTSPLGTWLGQHGYHLLTGGGQGVMAAVSKAFACVPDREGMIIGIIPAKRLFEGEEMATFEPEPGYPNKWIEIPVFTHLPLTGAQGKENLSRNHINVLTSDLIIALPGGEGTRSEIELAIEYEKPIIIFDPYSLIPNFSSRGVTRCHTFSEVIGLFKSFPAIAVRS